MSRLSTFRAAAALSLAGFSLLTGASIATAAPSQADAVAAVNALVGPLPTGVSVVSAAFSPNQQRLAFRETFVPSSANPATAPSQPQTVNTDLWTIHADGTQLTRLTDTEATLASGYSDGSGHTIVNVTDPTWAPNSAGLAYVVSGPDHRAAPTTKVVAISSAGVDDWAGEHSYAEPGSASGLTYTPDGHYLVYRITGMTGADDYAVDLSTSTEYFVRHLGAPTSPIWAPECATVTEGSYAPPIHSGNDVVDDNPACKFGVAADASAPTGTTPSTISGPSSTPAIGSLDDAPGITASTNHRLTPISEQLPASAVPGPALSITAVGKGLTGARKNGLHVKYTLSRLATVKAWVILKDSGARYALPNAFAGVPASTVARGTSASSKPGAGSMYLKFDSKGKNALTGVNRATFQLKITATDVAGRSTTVVQSVTLRR